MERKEANDDLSAGEWGRDFSHKREIDWPEQFRKVRASGKLLLKVCGMGAAVGIVVALGIPEEYTASTLVAHEGIRRRSYSDISELADMAGDTDSSIATERDGLYPTLYATIVASTPFLLQLFDVEVHRQEDSAAMPLAQYLKEHQKAPWWRVVTSAPSRLMGWCLSLFKEKPEVDNTKKKVQPDTFRLTREEAAIAGAIASRITIEIDKKKKAITISVTMQDPLVAATVADTVQARLKAYMTEYRTGKSRRILEYNEKLCKEAQAEYHAAQDRYARFADANRNLTQLTPRAEQARLRSEMELAQLAYNRMERQVQAAKARVKKVAPVYTVIRPVTVPLRPSKPNKWGILAGYVLLSGAGGIGWILWAKDFIRKIIKSRTAHKPVKAND